jgi:hypothetical protein
MIFERHVQKAREKTGKAAFEIQVTEGCAMIREEAVKYT